MNEPHSSSQANRNGLQFQEIGTVARRMQTRSVTASNIKERLESAAAEANDPTDCPDNAVHTTLYPFGEGGWLNPIVKALRGVKSYTYYS